MKNQVERNNWISMAKSVDSSNRVLALELAERIKDSIQEELLFWFCSNPHFETKVRIYELLDDQHKILADEIAGKHSLKIFDENDNLKYLKASDDMDERKVLLEMEAEGQHFILHLLSFIEKYRKRKSCGVAQAKLAIDKLRERAKDF